MLFNILNVNEKEKKRKNLTSLNINLALDVIIACTSVTCAVGLSDIMCSTDFSFQKLGFSNFI
jgi:hypothetical protein